ncbi:lipoate--protein ligase family protein [Lacipirellula parvula]|uniref:Lipoate-protein ligase A n=1 Tax=Lacipirellula parvula TaxID=2650471 RepID=A0A5K7XLH0_9BACT|nr:lipoate--protein ligase [Lacipirellula parvula]BBO35486.1 lipoate-protein ligase A [Lacipirellula parvula]
MTPCRLIVDPPLDGAWNMGFDEALLEQAADSGVATLRFYQWQEPTLSLGYFQSYDERDTHAASRQAAVVRRQSGGGALMHDRELTYSLSLPADHPLARQSPQLYDVVHRSLIDCLAAEGVTAALHSDRTGASSATLAVEPTVNVEETDAAAEPFLCFARRTSADVVLPGSVSAEPPVKIVGSAQRRRRGAVLQHGSILLDRSPAAPELAGIEQISGVSISPDWIIKNWTASLAALLKLDPQPFQPAGDSALMTRAEELRAGKYADSAWTRRR